MVSKQGIHDKLKWCFQFNHHLMDIQMGIKLMITVQCLAYKWIKVHGLTSRLTHVKTYSNFNQGK